MRDNYKFLDDSARFFGGLLCLLFSLCVVQENAFSQTSGVGETVEERQHSRSQDQLRTFERELERAPSGIEAPGLEQLEEVEKTGNCVLVDAVEIKGLEKYSPNKFDDLIQKSEGQCLYISDINNILRVITNQYIKAGFVTSRAFLPEQDLTDGSLEIAVLEGAVEALRGVDEAFSARELAFAFPIKPNKRLNLRDIEQGIDQLSRLPSRNPTSDIEAGTIPGSSIVLIDNNATRRAIRGNISLDNSGQSSTGETIFSGSVSADNILGVSDFWNVSANTSIDAGDDSGARGINGFLSIPYGYFSTSFSGGYFAFDTIVPGVIGDIESDGTSWFANASVDWLAYRDATRKLSFTSGIGITDNDNFISGVRLLASSFRLASLNFGVDYQERILGGLFSTSASWKRGTNLLGADSIFTGDDGPQRIFNKLEYNANFSRPIRFKNETAERISIGSPSAVRGFRGGGISGDEGVYLRQELTWAGLCCEISSGWLEDDLDISAFAGFDVGRIRRDPIDGFERGVLKSVTAGTRINVKNLHFSFSASHGFSSPFFVTPDDVELNASVSVRF